jgi:hypothetical protein
VERAEAMARDGGGEGSGVELRAEAGVFATCIHSESVMLASLRVHGQMRHR